MIKLYDEEMSSPSIESMLFALLTENRPEWPIAEHERILQKYFSGSRRCEGIKIDNLLEVGLCLELAERFRSGGDTGKAKELIKFALENHPGTQSLIRFEKEFDPSQQIKWQRVMELKVN